MELWWNSLDMYYKVLWGVALASSAIFIFQAVMTFAGMDSGTDFDADFDGDMDTHGAFQLFTLRNLVNFMLGFSWTAIALKNTVSAQWLLILVSALAGVALVVAVMYMFLAMTRLQQSGNMEVKGAVGATGTVYLTIPGQRSGAGKIHIKIQNTLREVDAVTEGDAIPTGAMIKVTSVLEDTILIVTKI
ncbi:MAG: serine protease [Flavobacteriales bacterium]